MRGNGHESHVLFEQAPDGMAVVNPETGEHVDVNERYCSLYGYSRADLLEQEIGSLTADDQSSQRSLRSVLQALDDGECVRWRMQHADGTTFPAELRPNRVEYKTRERLLVRVIDRADPLADNRDPPGNTRTRDDNPVGTSISETSLFKQLVEHLPVGVFRTTPGPDGEFIEVNPQLVSMFGASSKADLRRHSVSDLYHDASEREAFSDSLTEHGKVVQREVQLQRLDGTSFWGAITAVRVEDGDDVYFDGIVQDISQRMAYERQLEEQRDNLEILNQVVRHDIRNDLQLVISYAEVLEDHVDTSGQEYLSKVEESADDAVELTTTARDIAETMLRTDADREPVSLRKTLEEQIDGIRSTYDSAVVTVPDSLPDVTVMANEMLDSVFRNVMKNAVQHNDAAVPEVTVTVTDHDQHVVVHIADNGPGVPDDRKDAIFGKGEKGLDSDGTGIGLYLVHTLVTQYGGDVWVQDRTDQGLSSNSEQTEEREPQGAVFNIELEKVSADTTAAATETR